MTDLSASDHSVSIIVPTLNEEENIAPLVAQITACAVPFREILFVDDYSTDATREEIRALEGSLPIRLIEQNGAEFGLASAIMSGARAAEGEILLVMDADLSHPPERIKDLLAPLFAGTADLVVGSRYVKGGSTPGWPVWRRIMSRAGAALAYPLTGLHDSMCGFFAIGRSRLLELAPHTSGFKIVFETIVRGGFFPLAARDVSVCRARSTAPWRRCKSGSHSGGLTSRGPRKVGRRRRARRGLSYRPVQRRLHLCRDASRLRSNICPRHRCNQSSCRCSKAAV
ncbi:MAG: hypothetical protein DMF28_08525 [Verrucomicrobia bacterium]|nr:MAG: hypothetical protein DMF28_08525 [Verrucomicrobiota bacterium]